MVKPARHHLRFISSLIALVMLTAPLFSQTGNLKFERISIEKGLSQSVVYSIFQDSRGFLWIGTQDGLNRYDGYSFRVYKSKPYDSTSLSDSWIQAITEDKKGNLWIGTHNGGLYKFDRKEDRFTNFRNIPLNPNSLINNRIWTLYLDKSENLWIGTSGGLDKFDISKESFTHYGRIDNQEFGLSNNAVNSICEDGDGVLWLGTFGGGLNRFDKSKGVFSHFTFDQGKPELSGANRIKAIFDDRKGSLWLGTYSGLIRFDKKSSSSVRYLINEQPSGQPNKNSILAIYEDQKGNLWAGTHDEGLNLFDPASGKFTGYQNIPMNSGSLSDNWVQAIFQDRSGVLWVGTGNGLNKTIPGNQNFAVIQNNPTQANSLSANEVNALFEDHDGVIWVGTWRGGLNSYDRRTNSFKTYKHNPADPSSLPDNMVWTVFEDSRRDIWVGTYAGLSRFDRKSGRFTTIRKNGSDPNSISHNNISAVYEDSYGYLWVGTWDGGLNKLSSDRKTIERYTYNPSAPKGLSNDLINVIYQDSKKRLWIGTQGGGLNLYNYKENDFKCYKYNSHDRNSLSNSSVKSICEDSHGIIWIGTWGGGLNKFDPEKNQFTHFSEAEGLANNSIYAILADNSGDLWISTNKGLSRFNTSSGRFVNYGPENGLANEQFNPGSLKCKDGTMMFGGINGITVFDPAKVKINYTKPQIILTSVKKFSEEVNFEKLISEKGAITLNYDENYITVEFASLDFSHPERNQYAYMLEGVDKGWTYSGSRRIAYYTDLQPGEYILHIKATNSDNVWNDEGISIPVHIIPPFWATLWFRLAAIMVLVMLVLLYVRMKVNAVQKQKIRLEQQVRERTDALEKEIAAHKKTEEALILSEEKLREANSNKDKLFSIVANDLRSPFISLMGYLDLLGGDYDKLSKQEIGASVTRINNTIRKLYLLTENLLQWSGIHSGQYEFKPGVIKIRKALDAAISSEEVRNVSGDIVIENLVSAGHAVMADSKMFTSIFQNLILTSVRFSGPGKAIKLISEEESNYINVKICDNGAGMTQADKLALFNIGVQYVSSGRNEEQDTGLSLIITRDMIEKNGGIISIESQLGEGTIISVKLPAV